MKTKCLSLVLLLAGVALGLVEPQHLNAFPLSVHPGNDAVAGAAGDQNGPATAQGGNGIFEIGLASDGNQALVVQSAEITVGGLNQPPVANASATPISGNAPLLVQLSSAGSSDPDGTITSYYWNFGDVFGVTSNEPNPTYQYGYAGTYTATLTITDNNNVSSSDTLTITVSPDPTTLLRSTAINLTAKLAGSKVTATGQVTVKDATGKLISGATVTAQWRRPDGSTVTQSATTGGTGVAQFQTRGGRGTYTLTVTDIYKYLYTFDAAGSVLSKSITK